MSGREQVERQLSKPVVDIRYAGAYAMKSQPSNRSDSSVLAEDDRKFDLKSVRLYPIRNQAVQQIPILKLGQSNAYKYGYALPETSDSALYAEFLAQEPIMRVVDEQIRDMEFRPPKLSDIHEHLAAFGTGWKDESHEASQLVESALARLRVCMGPVEPVKDWLTPAGVFDVRVPAGTSPGIRFRKLGYKTKGDALRPACHIAAREIQMMTDEGVMPAEIPTAVAGRGKMVAATDPFSGKEGRLIIIPDLVRHLIGSLGAGKFYELLQKSDRPLGGVDLGLGPYSGKWPRLMRRYGDKTLLMLDFSKFDSTIPAWLLKAAFTFVRSFFAECPGADAYWEHEYRRLVHTAIVLPDGEVLRKSRGVASGDPWTSIMDSICNFIIIHAVYHPDGDSLIIGTFGDDSLTGGAPVIISKLDMAAVAARALRLFGVVVHPVKSYFSAHLCLDPGEEPSRRTASYLSMWFNPEGYPVPSATAVLAKLWHPERRRAEPSWEIVRVIALLYLSFWNTKLYYHLTDYYIWLRIRYPAFEVTPEIMAAAIAGVPMPPGGLREDSFRRAPSHHELLYLYRHGGKFEYSKFARHALLTSGDADMLISEGDLATLNPG